MNDEKKYLLSRNGNWHYYRVIPSLLHDRLGKKARRTSLKTRDLAVAMKRRDLMASADDDYWGELLNGVNRDSAEAIYNRVIARAKNLNIDYKPSQDILSKMDFDVILQRIEMLEGNQGKSRVASSAVLGLAKAPLHKMSVILPLYENDIMATAIKDKNNAQRHRWQTGHKRIIDTFIQICGDLAIVEIGRDDALKYQKHFKNRVMSLGDDKLSIGAANREIGTMATIFKRYHSHYAINTDQNPFDALKFAGDQYTPRPPFSVEWIKQLIGNPKNLSTLNLTARAITLAMVETGMRHIEICNLLPENIIIDTETPHVCVQGRAATAAAPEGYELKTDSSLREIPLQGVSLAAFKVLKGGIGQYFGKPDVYSAAANKFLRDNDLMESEKHSLYSFRHSFKDRMIEAGIDDEMRDLLMGHSDPKDRPKYGKRGGMEYRAKILKPMILEFDEDLLKP